MVRRGRKSGAILGLVGSAAMLVLGGCTDPVDFDLRGDLGRGFDTSDAVLNKTENRPASDDRGIISYSKFQVAVARRGDTVAAIASRVGIGAEELARYNGLATGDTLRPGEVLALPRRVAEPSPATGAPATGSLTPEPVDVATLAGSAIDRAEKTSPAAAAAPAAPKPAGRDPVRHKVARGETAYSIARLYNVSVRSLTEWNGLGPDLAIREGQYLLIPVAAEAPAPGSAKVEAPGTGSVTPPPPSAKDPLPDEKAAPATPKDAPASPDLGKDRSSGARLAMPVSGKIIREYAKGRNEGINIGASAGATVVAAGDGTVAAITRDTEQVPIVVIRHAGNLLTVYAGLDAIKVAKGDRVKRGQAIGVVRAGTPPFVHFEVREGFESVDPVPFLN
jgi:murein DD-endopeptidase MepM/ murein hydrolase activator NlpD